jgi:hypothetical protein
MGTVYTGLLDEPFDGEDRDEAITKLKATGFAVDTDDAGWIAEYSAGRYRVRVEAIPDGWLVSQVRIAGSFERVKAEEFHSGITAAAGRAVAMATVVNSRLRLVGSVAGPLLAELGRTS